MVFRGENVIITTDVVKATLSDYANKNNKISRDIRDGKLHKIVNGLYETDINTPGYLLAGSDVYDGMIFVDENRLIVIQTNFDLQENDRYKNLVNY